MLWYDDDNDEYRCSTDFIWRQSRLTIALQFFFFNNWKLPYSQNCSKNLKAQFKKKTYFFIECSERIAKLQPIYNNILYYPFII